MKQSDAMLMVRELTPVFRSLVAEAVAPLRERIAELEGREISPAVDVDGLLAPLVSRLESIEQRPMPELPVSMRGAVIDRDGCLILQKSNGDAENLGRIVGRDPEPLTVADVEPLIADEVARQVADIPPAQPGRSVTLDEVAPLIEGAVERRLAEWPKPEPGKPGKDADPEVIRSMVAEAVAILPPAEKGKDAAPELVAALVDEKVREAVAALPPAEPGKSITVDDMRPLIEAEVTAAIEALPPPENGKDVDPEMVAALVDEKVRAAVAALPAPQPGKDADPELVTSLVAETVHEAVAALPPPRQGEPGPPGSLPIVKAWEDRVYYGGNVAYHNGATYQALRDTAKEPPHADWQCIAAAGRDGRTPRIRGTWIEPEQYEFLDVVMLNGASFVARRDDPGVCPGEDWQLMAAQGKRGNPGPKGDKVTGNPGPPGPPIKDVHVDDNGMLTLTNADGSVVTCDLYPLLAKIGG